MKINVSSIVRDHFDTLYDVRSDHISRFDIALFYGFPSIAAGASYYVGLHLKPDAYSISITFFGIFIALILNIQVAMFSIFQRKWEVPSDKRIASSMAETLADRKKLIIELNANLSYLILVCCVALVLSLTSFIKAVDNELIPAVMLFLYAHFLLTLLMIVKRAHALFHKEYRDSPS
jgi:glucan phosphoethanolaminetransferase (alkaline phosphatase superfamily)